MADVTDPYEAALNSLPSAVNELLLRILRLGIGSPYDVRHLLEMFIFIFFFCVGTEHHRPVYFSSQIDIHCIKSLNELPESGSVAVLNQVCNCFK